MQKETVTRMGLLVIPVQAKIYYKFLETNVYLQNVIG